MKKLMFCTALLAMIVSCRNNAKEKVVRYADAEKAFTESLTLKDTTDVLAMTDAFMTLLSEGQIDSAVRQVNVLEADTLYKSSFKYKIELATRFNFYPVKKFELVRLSFSTEGNNDVCYKYWFDDQHTMKLVFNPVKIDDTWYITMKDGTQSSKDLTEDQQIHPDSPAPSKIVLHKRP